MAFIDDALAVGSIGASLLSPLLGASSQNAANKLNAGLVRETNQLNKQMFDEQLAQNWKMFDATNAYNTPENQRKLLEQAGYNPALYGGNGSTAQALSTPGAVPAQVGHEMKALFDSQALSGAVANGASSVHALMSASNQKQEALGKKIDNMYKAANYEADLYSKGQNIKSKAISNAVQEATFDDTVEAAGLANENVKASTLKQQKEAVVQDVLAKYHVKNTEYLDKAIDLVVAQKDETLARKYMQEALGDKYKADAAFVEIQASLAPAIAASQIEANRASAIASRAQASYFSESAVGQQIQNAIAKRFGNAKAAQDLLNAVSQGHVSEQEAWKLFYEAKSAGVDMDYKRYHSVLDAVNSAMETLKKIGMFTNEPFK